jgi:hypothetical protein
VDSEKDISLAWAAGLFEGEGCISVNSRAGGGKRFVRQWILELSSCDADVVHRFASTVGAGKVRERNKLTVAGKRVWTWGVYNKADVVDVLNLMLPNLGIRRSLRAYECLNEIESAVDTRRTKKSLGML